jgi:VWFA-related protein
MRALWKTGSGLFLFSLYMASAQQAVTQKGAAASGLTAEGKTAPTAEPATSISGGTTGEGRLQLDVVVTDLTGKPATNLGLNDFTLRDNNRPTKILSLHAWDAVQKTDPPIEIILILDTVNLGTDQVVFMRQEMAKFLRRNEGRLAQPVSVYIFSADGLKARPPITDGNKLAAELDQLGVALRTADLTTGAGADAARFQLSLKWLSALVRRESTKPGRKLVIWGGPGWPSLDGPDYTIPTKMLQGDFNLLVDLSTLLRQGRVTLYSISAAMPAPSGSVKNSRSSDTTSASNLGTTKATPSGIEAFSSASGTSSGKPTRKALDFSWSERDYQHDAGPFQYKTFLKGVKSWDKATPPYLGLKVLATQSGGLVLGPENNLAEQIVKCVEVASSFYRISFDPAHVGRGNEFHELKLEVAQKGLTARTFTNYYSEP